MLADRRQQNGPITCPAGHLLAEMVDGVVWVKDGRRTYAGRIAFIKCDCGRTWRLGEDALQSPPQAC